MAIKLKDSQQTLRHRPDYMITVLVILLVGLSMIMLYSTGSIANYNISGGTSYHNNFFQSQLISLVLGLLGWWLVSKINYKFWQKAAPYIFYVSIILMVLVLLPSLALKVNGATRWLRLGIFSFQPVEFFKLALVLFLASWFEKNRNHATKFFTGLVPFILIIGLISVLIILLQKDMGSAVVVIAMAMSIYFVSTGPIWLYGLSLVSLLTGLAAAIYLFPYRLARLTSFLNYSSDTTGASYHINQALVTLGSGRLFGRGLGNSLQAYGYLPQATNDSIFAIIGEEFGFVGTMTVLVLFSALLYRSFKICRLSPDNFARLVAVGITSWVGFQTLINIAAMLNLVPLTGITLPFVSYGGTSLIFLLVAMGILQNISRYTSREVHYESSRLGRGNRRPYITDLSGGRKIKNAR